MVKCLQCKHETHIKSDVVCSPTTVQWVEVGVSPEFADQWSQLVRFRSTETLSSKCKVSTIE